MQSVMRFAGEVRRAKGIPVRVLGRTGVEVTVICAGGYHIGKHGDPKKGIDIIRKTVDEGINFLDNAWCYNAGESERIMGLAFQGGYREKVFSFTRSSTRASRTASSVGEQLKRR